MIQNPAPASIAETGKDKERIRAMFNDIAPTYDFLNHLFSFGIDKRWRKFSIHSLLPHHPKMILDVATGTGDSAIETAGILKPEKIIGIDLSANMISAGKEKLKQKNLEGVIEMVLGESEALPFADATFDAATVAFGVRNFSDLHKGMSEMYRVLKKDGRLVVLEFSRPRNFPVKQLFGFYFNTLLPFAGKLVSGHGSAYSYLPQSVSTFPDGDNFVAVLQKAGFSEIKFQKLSFGISTVYTAAK